MSSQRRSDEEIREKILDLRELSEIYAKGKPTIRNLISCATYFAGMQMLRWSLGEID